MFSEESPYHGQERSRLNHINPFPSPQVADFSKLTKRKRLTQACEGCRKKKVRCDGGKPACANCARRNIECTYVPSTNKRGPRQGYIEKLEKRLDMMEKLLEPLKPNEGGEGENESEARAEYDTQEAESDDSGRSVTPEASACVVPSIQGLPQSQVPTLSQPSPSTQNQASPAVTTSSYLATVVNDHSPSPYAEYPGRAESVHSSRSIASNSSVGGSHGNSGYSGYHGVGSNEASPHRKKSVVVGSSSSLCANPYMQATISSGDNFETLINLITRSWLNDKRVRGFIHEDGYSPSAGNPYEVGPTRSLSFPEISDRLINAYFDLVNPQYTVVHRAQFMRDLEAGTQSELLLYCIYAVTARYVSPGNPDSKHTFAAGDYFASRAKSLMGQCCDEHTVSNVQALFLLALHAYGSGHGSGGWLYSGMATRMAQEIGMNRVDEKATDMDPPRKLTWIEKETCRRIWWSLYALERIISIGTGRQTVIDENDCEVALPSDDSLWETSGDPKYQPDPGSSSPGGLAYLVTLTTIMGRVYQFQNRLKLSRGSPSSLHAEFAILDAALVSWNISLPSRFQYEPRDPLPPGLDGRFAVWIRLHYYAALITLHRCNIGCTDAGPAFPVSLTFANSSFDRCITSASGITEVLAKIQDSTEYFVHSSVPLITCISGGIHVKNMFSKDQRISSTARHSLDVSYGVVNRLKAQWAQCFRYLGMLKDIEDTLLRLSS
ncbi:hypothetical protein K493DRAFT_313193 [Basidiobolus meristosporus CBS 931.73]|uniref:Zn(2)-C6 fungal-type domain-containing protein n=1 Tax=Basidiobolus meristosporus CBS 931.73 TaxID=1314790 RepID=A0A1Y1YPK2_9FUNG|nr:hypothetical protein K493DRAFT_313193 [Basidiobolus meristosporus CBS 931.73]|eukprot:ORX99514.1 hypothetical protein K493DRAFT_313193 [Basidiobolus meristosporus CBS 931.73]